MRMSLVSRFTRFGSVAALISLLAAPRAFALSVPGYSSLDGKYPGWTGSCVQEKNGGALNSCGYQIGMVVPLNVNEGMHTMTVATNNPGGGTFMCQAMAADQFGTTTTGTAVYPNTGNRTSLVSVTVPRNGSMWVYCNVNPNGIVWSVNYNKDG